MLESHPKCEYSITCKELGYGPAIYQLLKWSNNFNVGFTSWFDLQVILWVYWDLTQEEIKQTCSCVQNPF